ncbi:MAG: hypothetical protein ACKV2T_04435 [Kofleriaceae bacterium]
MKKQDKKKTTKKGAKPAAARTPMSVVPPTLNWTPLFGAFRDAFEWALDIARAIARDYPEEVEAVERVRTFMRKRIAGESAAIDEEDILFTFGLLLAAIERDLGPIGKRVSTAALASRLAFPSAAAWERLFLPGASGSYDAATRGFLRNPFAFVFGDIASA